MKYKKSILIFVLLVLALFTMACVSAGDVNDTLTASDDNQITDDEPAGQSNDFDSDKAYGSSLSDDEILGVNLEDEKLAETSWGFMMLNSSIAMKKKGETLELGSDFKHGLLGEKIKKIQINKPITIDGKGHTIDADDDNVMIFEINCNDVTLQNIKFKNSFYSSINCTKSVSSIKIINCTFEDTVGSAVWFNGNANNCIIQGCEFIKNDPKESSYSAVNFWGKATNCSLVGNVFMDNGAHYGSAMVFWKDVEKCEIGGYFYGKPNVQSQLGGAISFFGKFSDSKITGIFHDNVAESGGAIYFGGNVSNSTINGEFRSNKAVGNATDPEAVGGAILFNSTVSDTTIGGRYMTNKALGDDAWAGAICFNKGADNIGIYGEFSGNIAEREGGAIYCPEYIRNSIINANFEGNKASISLGGAIGVNMFINTNISGFFYKNSAYSHGGALVSNTIINSTISANFDSNKVTDESSIGGAILVNRYFFNSDIIGEFRNNSAQASGGAIYIDYITYSNISAKFIGNKVTNNDGKGGAIYVYGWQSYVSNCVFIGNSAGEGIVYVEDSPSISRNMILNNNTFLNNNGTPISFRVQFLSSTNFNWFGSNASNYIMHQQDLSVGSLLFLNATLDYSSFFDSNSIDVTFKLYVYDVSGRIFEYDNNPFKDLDLAISVSNGDVNKSVVKLGETFKFTPSSKEPGIVTAQIENAYQTIKINVKGDFDSLQELIDNSTSSVINLKRSYEYNMFDRMTEGIVINRTLTINGNGFSIDAKGKSRIFNITSDNVEIKNIIFLNGNSEGNGGAIFINATNASVSNSVFKDNSAADGVVYFDTADGVHSNLKINNNIFLDNGVCEIYFDEIDDNSNADYNWFGNNETNYDSQPETTNVNLNNWMFLNATASSSSISIFETLDALFKLYLYNSASRNISEYDNSAFENLNLQITATGGNVNKSTAKLGETIKFIPFRGGNASVTANAGDFYITIEFNIKKGDFDQLQDLIDDTTSFVINLTRNYTYNEFDSMAGGIVIDIPVTINGNGFVIDAKGKSRIFDTVSNNVVIKDITFMNAKSDYGGAIKSREVSACTIENCNFINNTATDYGGAIYFKDSNGSIVNCSFNNNSADHDGGAIYFNSDYTVILANSSFTNNTAAFKGGALLFYGKGNVTNCNFINNTAIRGGGGAVVFESEGDITNCNFINNKAIESGSCGGAIQLKCSNLINCNFTDNYASAMGGAVFSWSMSNVVNCNFINNAVSYQGGAVFSWSSCNVVNCNFINNAVSYQGGAIYLASKDGACCNVTNCSFSDNYAKYDGGAIRSEFDGNVINCSFTDNRVGDEGGAIYVDGNFTVSNSNFTDNHADWGGAISIGSNCTVITSNFIINTATKGGAIYFRDDGEVTNCSFTGNTATGGGAVYFVKKSTGSTINCSFTGNTATGGGAIYFDDESTGMAVNCSFIGNTATGNDTHDGGGAVYFDDESTGMAVNCSFIGNTATEVGGAVYFDYESTSETVNCNFISNTASFGGALFIYSDDAVTNCSFTGNTATEAGGAILFHFEGTVSNCSFINNSVTGNHIYGGAIEMGNGTVVNCSFINNSVTGNVSFGGAVFFVFDGAVINCNFTNNSANGDKSAGGAVRLNGVFTVVNSNFINNSVTGNHSYGGAIDMGHGNVTNCNFTDNYASFGGAIDMNYGNVTNSNFTGNNAINGSAIYFYNISTTKSVSNSCFLNNRANAEALDVVQNENNITIIFTGKNNILNAIYSRDDAEVTFTNVTYWGENGITNTGSSPINLSGSNNEAGQNITVGVIVNDELVLNKVHVTDENGMIVLGINVGNNYFISVRHDEDSYYTEAKTIVTNMKFYSNVTSVTTNNKTVNITAKSNIPNDIVQGELMFILPNGTEINANYGANGTWWALHTFDDYGDYNVSAKYSDLDNLTVVNATISIRNVIPINVKDISISFGEVAEITAGVPEIINNQNLTITVNGNSKNVTVNKGEAKASFADLPADEYVITVEYLGDGYNSANSTTAKLTVSRINSTLTVDNVTLEHGQTANVSVKTEGASGIAAKIDGKNVTVKDNIIEIPLLDVGNHSLVVTTIPDSNHIEVTQNATITINLIKTNVTVDQSAINLSVGENVTVHAKATPDGIKVNFSTSNPSIVSVDKDGNIKALGEGNATITVSVGDNVIYKYDSVTVNVTVAKVPVEIKITNETLNLKVNGVVDSAASLIPPDAGNPTYISNNESVVSINNGQITAVGEGTATVTVSFTGNEKYAAAENKTITVNVGGVLKDASVSVDVSSVNLKVGENYTIHATTNPDNLNVTYKSSDESVITVDNGFIVAVGEGNATVTVTVGDNVAYALNSTVVNVTVSKIATEIIIVNETIDLKVNGEADVGASLNPKDAPVDELVYESSDETIVKIENSKIIAAGEGDAVVSVSFKGNNKYAAAVNKTITVHVSLNDASVNVSKTVYNLNVGDNDVIVAVPTPANLKVNFTTNNPDVVSVDDDGNIIALGEGNASITVSVGDNIVYKYDSVIVNVTVSKIATEITADAVSQLVFGEKANVTYSLKPGDAEGNITFESSNSNIIKVDSNGEITAVGVGSANITVTFSGNNKYAESSKSIKITVIKANSTLSVDDIAFDYGETGSVNVSVSGAVEVTADVVGHPEAVVNVNNNTITVSGLNAGNYTLTVNAVPDDNHNPVTKTASITVNKINSALIVDDVELYCGVTKEVNVTFEGAKGITAKIDENNATVNGNTITIPVLDGGTYTLTVTTVPDDNHNPVTKTATVTVLKQNVTPDISMPANITVGENSTVEVQLPADAEGNVTVKVDSEVVDTVPVTNGSADVAIPPLSAGNHTVEIAYSGDGKYNPANETEEITVSKKDSVPDITIPSDIAVGDDVAIDVTLPGDAGGNVTLKVDGEVVDSVPVTNGSASVKLPDLSAGNHTVEIDYSGDDKYSSVSETADVSVSKVDVVPEVSVPSDIAVGDNSTVNVVLPVDAEGNVTVKVDGEIVDVADVVNGTANLTVPSLSAGNHTVEVDYSGDGKYNPVNKTGEISVSKVDVVPEVSVPSDITVGENSTVDVQLPDDAAGNVTVKVDGEIVDTVPVRDGSADVAIPPLSAGNHTVEIAYSGDGKYKPVNKTEEITVSKNDTAPEISIPSEITLDDDAGIEVKLPVDAAGNVILKVDGEVVDTADVVNGSASVKLPTKVPGNHTVEVAYSGDDKYSPSTKTAVITVNRHPTNLAAANVTATYKVSKYLTVKLTDSKGNPLANATVNVVIKSDKNYTTDANGQIKIKVSKLTPKTYTAKITFAGDDKYAGSAAEANVVVKKASSKITANFKMFKTSTKTKKYTITLKDNTGKAIKNAKVKLKVKGKTYTAKTNSKGKATFRITKLNKEGTFKAKITYKGNKYFKKATKKVKIKVITTFKTVSKGSKDKSTVKEIQRALKNNGYYLTYKGHYLKVDGIYHDCTKRSVKEFQNDKKLKVTGKVDEKTAKKLKII